MQAERPSTPEMSDKPIFFDASGRRAARLSVVGWAGAILSTILGIAFVASILAAPRVASPDLPIRMTANNALVRKAVDPDLLKSAGRLAAEARAREKTRAPVAAEERERYSVANAFGGATSRARATPDLGLLCQLGRQQLPGTETCTT